MLPKGLHGLWLGLGKPRESITTLSTSDLSERVASLFPNETTSVHAQPDDGIVTVRVAWKTEESSGHVEVCCRSVDIGKANAEAFKRCKAMRMSWL